MASALASSLATSSAFAVSTRSGCEPLNIPQGRSAFACHVGLRKVQLTSVTVSKKHERACKCQGVRAKDSEPSFLKKIGTALQKANKKTPVPEPEVPKGTGWFKLGASKGTGLQKAAAKKGSQLQKAGTSTAKAGTAKLAPNFTSLAQGFTKRLKATDSKTVFVAGATGQTGVRVAKELLAAGLSVRAGVPDAEEAERLLAFAVQYEFISREDSKRVSIVEYDMNDVDSIAESIGNAGKVVLTLGSAENGPRGRVGGQDAVRVLEAAQSVNASHFVLVTTKGGASSGGTGFFGGLFGGGAKAVSDQGLVDKLAESGLTYTVVRTAPDGEGEGNLVVGAEGAALGGTVSRFQVAELVAGALADLEVAKNKVVEVSSSPDAPRTEVSELFRSVPEDGRYGEVVAARQAAEEAAAAAEKRRVAEEEEAERRAQAQEAARAAAEEASAAEARKKELEAESKQMQQIGARAAAAREKARARAESAGTAVQSAAAKAEKLNVGPLDAVARPAKKAASSFNFGSIFNKAEQGAEEAEDEIEDAAKKVGSRLRAGGVRKAAQSEPVKEVKKAAGVFNFGSLLPKKEEVEEPVKEVKKSAFSIGALLPKKAEEAGNGAAAKVQRSRPVAAAVKQASRVGSRVQKASSQVRAQAPKPEAPKKAGAKKGGLFGGLLPSEEDYLYED